MRGFFFMASFITTSNPTPFGFYDHEVHFQMDADKMLTFVRRRLGDDIISVELTNKQIWAAFEEATLEYSRFINENMLESHIHNLLGIPVGGITKTITVNGQDVTQTVGPNSVEGKLPRENFDIFMRKAEVYATEAGVGGSTDHYIGYIKLEQGRQDYNITEELIYKKDGLELNVFDELGLGVVYNGNFVFYKDIILDITDPAYDAALAALYKEPRQKSKPRIYEVMHFSPQAAYRFFDTTSSINYLNNQFAFESFTPETVFYVLPVFEDVLRAGQLDISNRIRRSNYSYEIHGNNIRIYPKPTTDNPYSLFIRFAFPLNPVNPDIPDEKINGVSNISNVPYGNLPYDNLNSIARHWIREFTLAIAKEMLGVVRSKFSSIPIPGGDLQLNGSDMISSGREDQEKLRTQLKEMLDKMTMTKILETQNAQADQLQNLLKKIPIPNGPFLIG
jgi:hypothetical protein